MEDARADEFRGGPNRHRTRSTTGFRSIRLGSGCLMDAVESPNGTRRPGLKPLELAAFLAKTRPCGQATDRIGGGARFVGDTAIRSHSQWVLAPPRRATAR